MSDLRRVGLVHAGGLGVYDESREAQVLIERAGCEPVFIAVNEAGIALPVLHHWGSLHPNKLGLWAAQREELGLPNGYKFWALNETNLVRDTVRNWSGGSSGLHGIDIALNALGLRIAIGCGMPLDDRPNQFTGKPWGAHGPFRTGWTHREVYPVIRDRVRIMAPPHPQSGEAAFTTHLLGKPTVEWIKKAFR